MSVALLAEAKTIKRPCTNRSTFQKNLSERKSLQLLNVLPDELITTIFTQVGMREFAHLREVSQTLKEGIDNQVYRHDLVIRWLKNAQSSGSWNLCRNSPFDSFLKGRQVHQILDVENLYSQLWPLVKDRNWGKSVVSKKKILHDYCKLFVERMLSTIKKIEFFSLQKMGDCYLLQINKDQRFSITFKDNLKANMELDIGEHILVEIVSLIEKKSKKYSWVAQQRSTFSRKEHIICKKNKNNVFGYSYTAGGCIGVGYLNMNAEFNGYCQKINQRKQHSFQGFCNNGQVYHGTMVKKIAEGFVLRNYSSGILPRLSLISYQSGHQQLGELVKGVPDGIHFILIPTHTMVLNYNSGICIARPLVMKLGALFPMGANRPYFLHQLGSRINEPYQNLMRIHHECLLRYSLSLQFAQPSYVQLFRPNHEI